MRRWSGFTGESSRVGGDVVRLVFGSNKRGRGWMLLPVLLRHKEGKMDVGARGRKRV